MCGPRGEFFFFHLLGTRTFRLCLAATLCDALKKINLSVCKTAGRSVKQGEREKVKEKDAMTRR